MGDRRTISEHGAIPRWTGIRILWTVAVDMVRLISSAAGSHSQLAAENLFLRKQLAFYIERQVKPLADDATRITLVALSSLFERRRILTIVKPDTLIGWHRKGFRLFWRRKSTLRGRPRLPSDMRQLIRDVAAANRTRVEDRIAAELLLKLGLRGRRGPFAAIRLPVMRVDRCDQRPWARRGFLQGRRQVKSAASSVLPAVPSRGHRISSLKRSRGTGPSRTDKPRPASAASSVSVGIFLKTTASEDPSPAGPGANEPCGMTT
jgi:hypothetical protein